MWKASFLLFVCLGCVLASSDTACPHAAADDEGDDRCQLLQSGVGLVEKHDDPGLHAPPALDGPPSTWHDPVLDDLAEPTVKPAGEPSTWHDPVLDDLAEPTVGPADAHNAFEKNPKPHSWWKKITDAAGGFGNLDGDFAKIHDSVSEFGEVVTISMRNLQLQTASATTSNEVAIKVSAAYVEVAGEAQKLATALKTVFDDFMKGIGSAMPENVKSVMSKHLNSVHQSSTAFVLSLNEAANELKFAYNEHKTEAESGVASQCVKFQSYIDDIAKNVKNMMESAGGLSSDALGEEVGKVKAELPDALRVQVDKVLEKANKAAEELQTLAVPVNEVASGVTKAFGKFCPDLHGAAGRLEVSLLTSSMLLILAFVL